MKANKIELHGNKLTFTLVERPNLAALDEFNVHLNNGKLIDVTVKNWRKKKSLNANALMWIICNKIGAKIGSSKEDVYRKVVREMGPFYSIPIRNEDAEEFPITWKGKGLGWFAEVIDQDEEETTFMAYYGSSQYNSKQMALLIDSLIYEANNLGIDTISPQDKAMVLERWGT